MTQRHILGLAKPRTLRIVMLTALGAAFVAACGGGGTGDTGGSGGGDTGSGGSATGGSATGGSGTSTGGSTGTGGAGNGTGGTANPSGGAANTGGDGGLGGGDGPGPGGDEDCPETMPGPEDACQGGFNAPTCTYGDQECECQGFGQNAVWECGEATEEPVCPEEAPEDGDPCTEQQACNFGGGNFCLCDGEAWNCP